MIVLSRVTCKGEKRVTSITITSNISFVLQMSRVERLPPSSFVLQMSRVERLPPSSFVLQMSRVERLLPSSHVKEPSVTAHYEHDEWSIGDLLHWQNSPSLPITFPYFESRGV